MKKMIVPVFALMLMTTAATAQEVKDAPQATDIPASAQATPATADQDDKVKVEIKDLPAAVQTALASEEYQGWSATAAWHVKGAPEHFAIDMQKGEESITVKLDKDGKKVG